MLAQKAVPKGLRAGATSKTYNDFKLEGQKSHWSLIRI